MPDVSSRAHMRARSWAIRASVDDLLIGAAQADVGSGPALHDGALFGRGWSCSRGSGVAAPAVAGSMIAVRGEGDVIAGEAGDEAVGIAPAMLCASARGRRSNRELPRNASWS